MYNNIKFIKKEIMSSVCNDYPYKYGPACSKESKIPAWMEEKNRQWSNFNDMSPFFSLPAPSNTGKYRKVTIQAIMLSPPDKTVSLELDPQSVNLKKSESNSVTIYKYEATLIDSSSNYSITASATLSPEKRSFEINLSDLSIEGIGAWGWLPEWFSEILSINSSDDFTPEEALRLLDGVVPVKSLALLINGYIFK